MKKLFKLLFALSLLVLVACGANSASETEQEMKPPRNLRYSGTAVYIDRQIERRNIRQPHKDKSAEEYVKAMNEEYGKRYWQVVEVDGKSMARFTIDGRLYFQGVDVVKVNKWLNTNPYNQSESELEKEKQAYRDAWEKGGDGATAKISGYQQQAVMGEYVNFAEIDEWRAAGKTLADYNAGFLGSSFRDSSGNANDSYWSARDRSVEKIEEKFNTYLTEDEQEMYNFTSDIRFDNDLIVYNRNQDYVFAISRAFSVENPNGGDDIEGRLYITGKVEGGSSPKVLDKFILIGA